jgi:hypothetical protein
MQSHGEQVADSLDHGVGGLARGDHDPDRSRRLESLDHLLQRAGADDVRLLGNLGDLRLVTRGGHHRVPIARQPRHHVEPHPSKSNKPNFHFPASTAGNLKAMSSLGARAGRPIPFI